MSDRQDTTDPHDAGALDLLDRAGGLAPQMAVRPEAVIAAGRRKVRRRRSSAIGAGTVTLAMAGALWVAGPLDPFTDSETLAPAAISWHDGVDVNLFDNQPHSSEVGRSHWTGELRSGEGDARPELVLTRDGTELEPIPAEDGPGDVMVFRTEGLSVAAWQPPAGSVGEAPVWTPGSNFGQGSSIEVSDAELRYAVAEFVHGATGELEELYWFSEDAAHAASGTVVDSAVLTIGDSSTVVMVDEARGTWGTVHDVGPEDNFVHLDPLKSGSGVTGWVMAEPVNTGTGGGPVTPNTTVGVLPPGAILSEPRDGVTQVHATVGSHTAVLASGPTSATAPHVQFTLDGSAYSLNDYGTSTELLPVAGTDVQIEGTPEGLQLFVAAGDWALIPTEDLDGDRAVVSAVGDGHVVIVPGWEPDVDVADLRVQTDSGEWLSVDSALAGTLFNGTPVMVLGLDAGVPGEGETIQGVGVADAGEVVPHDLDGVHAVDLDLDL